MTGRTADGRIETVSVVPEGSAVANYGFDVTPAAARVTGPDHRARHHRGSPGGLKTAFPNAQGQVDESGFDAQRRGSGVLLGVSVSAGAGEAIQPILDSAEHNKVAAIKLWERLVNVDSGTGDMTGINAVGAIAVDELAKLGAAIELVPAKPSYGDNVVASFTGSGQGKILLMAHMDTVFAKGAAARGHSGIDGKHAYALACRMTRPGSSWPCRF